MTSAVGIDLGGTNLRTAVVDGTGAILVEDRRPAPTGWEPLRAEMIAAVEAVRGTHPDVTAVGVGAAGMVGRDGVVRYSPNVHAFSDTPVRADLEAALGLPVVVDNDANVAAYAEVRVGAARGCDHALVITLGTGIGGGIVVDGHVLRGANGFAAEVGHFQIDPHGARCACGEPGHWEALASGNALGAQGREAATAGRAGAVLALAGSVDAIRGEHVAEAASAGDADALALLDTFAGYVAIGLVGLANILDPDRIVISGGLIALGDLLLEPVRRHFTGHIEGAAARAGLEIVPAELGTRAGVVGAALLAADATR